MSDSDDDRWPDYLPGPRKDILALGVITLNYGFLENMFRAVFQDVTMLTHDQVSTLFPKIQNDVRQRVLEQLLERRQLPGPLSEALLTFAKGYQICAENRHAIMHSFHGGTHTSENTQSGGIVLSRYARSGERLVCFADYAVLRTVADAMHAQADIAIQILLALQGFMFLKKYGREAEFELPPSLDKLPLPEKLDLRFQPEHRSDAPPPGPYPS